MSDILPNILNALLPFLAMATGYFVRDLLQKDLEALDFPSWEDTSYRYDRKREERVSRARNPIWPFSRLLKRIERDRQAHRDQLAWEQTALLQSALRKVESCGLTLLQRPERYGPQWLSSDPDEHLTDQEAQALAHAGYVLLACDGTNLSGFRIAGEDTPAQFKLICCEFCSKPGMLWHSGLGYAVHARCGAKDCWDAYLQRLRSQRASENGENPTEAVSV